MKIFLNLKHWQLFALQMGPALITQFILYGAIQTGAQLKFALSMFAVGMLFFMGTLFGWLYAVATGLRDKLPATVTMTLIRFKTALIIPIFYIAAILISLLLGPDAAVLGSQGALVALFIVPLHLLSMACIFYCLYFTAKSLKAAELQRPVEWSDFLGELFMIWFFPIGIWIIQPRVNRLFQDGTTPSAQPTPV